MLVIILWFRWLMKHARAHTKGFHNGLTAFPFHDQNILFSCFNSRFLRPIWHVLWVCWSAQTLENVCYVTAQYMNVEERLSMPEGFYNWNLKPVTSWISADILIWLSIKGAYPWRHLLFWGQRFVTWLLLFTPAGGSFSVWRQLPVYCEVLIDCITFFQNLNLVFDVLYLVFPHLHG